LEFLRCPGFPHRIGAFFLLNGRGFQARQSLLKRSPDVENKGQTVYPERLDQAIITNGWVNPEPSATPHKGIVSAL
jgi:hypothetical protein